MHSFVAATATLYVVYAAARLLTLKIRNTKLCTAVDIYIYIYINPVQRVPQVCA